MTKPKVGFIIGFVFLSSVAVSAAAETEHYEGRFCWIGEIEYFETTDVDYAWLWKIDWTFTPTIGDISKASSGSCFGSGGLIGGEGEFNHDYCIHNRVDGAKFMSKGKSSAQSSQTIIFGGTERLEGASGGSSGGLSIDLPAEDGKLVGCRDTKYEITLRE